MMRWLIIGFDTEGISVSEFVDWLQSKFGPVTVTEIVASHPIEMVPPPGHNFSPLTNQQVLNLFRDIFGSSDYWSVVMRAGLKAIAGNRTAVYSGPDVEALPLAEGEKARLISALSASAHPTTPTASAL